MVLKQLGDVQMKKLIALVVLVSTSALALPPDGYHYRGYSCVDHVRTNYYTNSDGDLYSERAGRC